MGSWVHGRIWETRWVVQTSKRWGWLGLMVMHPDLYALGRETFLKLAGYGQSRLTKARTTQASQLSADLWPVVVGNGWAD
ncbi:hypothetical protein PAXRUDRAFT_835786 [Paxillus rubicundulus Ve08.2h10]|uniref:Uncharacterized protein n=1 Tax=Paxillus rubicundulus Ve08.2h10 TaxID=930991 RepID=A0A0D0CJ07_9AGAM|nr:hypothetical protein PAXRUDRAFT_835786 [Paxillus rubicundulus Ve08.2h10]